MKKLDPLMDVYIDGGNLKKEIGRFRRLMRSSIEDDLAKNDFNALNPLERCKVGVL